MKKLFLGAAAVTLAFAPAKADVTSFFGINPFPISQYQTAYMTLGGGVLVRQMPSFNVPYSADGSTTPLFRSGASVITGGGGFTIGFRLDRLGIGDKPRIEIAFGGWRGSARKSGGDGFNGTTNIHTIDGSVVDSCGGCDGATSLRIRHTEVGGVLRLKTDFPIAPRFSATPSIGFMGSYSQTRFRSDTPFFFGDPGFDVPGFVKETVNARRLGGEIGLDVDFRATPRWSFGAGVAVAFFSLHANLKGNDCWSENQPAGQPCSGKGFTTSVEKNDTRFGIRVSMRVTATYDAGWLKISVTGFGGRDNAMPGVRNPTSADATPTGSASLYYESSWAYGGAVLATFPFFR